MFYLYGFCVSVCVCLDQMMLRKLLDHLKLVASYQEMNKMTCQNLAVCFGPVLLSQRQEASCHTNRVFIDSEELASALHFKKHIEVLHYLLQLWPGDCDLCLFVFVPLSLKTFWAHGVTWKSSTSTVRSCAHWSLLPEGLVQISASPAVQLYKGLLKGLGCFDPWGFSTTGTSAADSHRPPSVGSSEMKPSTSASSWWIEPIGAKPVKPQCKPNIWGVVPPPSVFR